MATLAVLRPFASILRPSVLLHRHIVRTPVRYASKTAQVASKAIAKRKLPASTTPKKSIKISSDHLSESAVLDTLPKSLNVKKAAKEAKTAKNASLPEASQASASSSVQVPMKSTEYTSAFRPTAASATAADAVIIGQVPKPSPRGISKWINPRFEDLESWATNNRTLGSRKKLVEDAPSSKPTQSPFKPRPLPLPLSPQLKSHSNMCQLIRRHGWRPPSPSALGFGRGSTIPLAPQHLCNGAYCHARLYTSFAMTPVAARGNRFGLVHLLVAGGSAAFLGAFVH